MLKDDFGEDLYFKDLMNTSRVFLTLEMYIANPSVCVGGLGGMGWEWDGQLN